MNDRDRGKTVDCNVVEQKAGTLFHNGYYCAESVLLAVAEHNGKSIEGLSRIVSGMCGGVSRSGGMCGALLGGIAAIGLLYGRDQVSDDKKQVYTLGYNLTRRFTEEFGSTLCSGVLGCDISTEEGTMRFIKEQLGTTRCLEITRKTTAIAQQLINTRDDLGHPLL